MYVWGYSAGNVVSKNRRAWHRLRHRNFIRPAIILSKTKELVVRDTIDRPLLTYIYFYWYILFIYFHLQNPRTRIRHTSVTKGRRLVSFAAGSWPHSHSPTPLSHPTLPPHSPNWESGMGVGELGVTPAGGCEGDNRDFKIHNGKPALTTATSNKVIFQFIQNKENKQFFSRKGNLNTVLVLYTTPVWAFSHLQDGQERPRAESCYSRLTSVQTLQLF